MKKRVRMIGHNVKHPGIVSFMLEGKNRVGRLRQSHKAQII